MVCIEGRSGGCLPDRMPRGSWDIIVRESCGIVADHEVVMDRQTVVSGRLSHRCDRTRCVWQLHDQRFRREVHGRGARGTATILSEPIEPTTFAQARAAMAAVYRSHPAIKEFSVKDVENTSATRNKVLGVCHKGGAEKSASSLESARVLACAPLIYYFYEYGRKAQAPDAVDAARKLYWYAVSLTARRSRLDRACRGCWSAGGSHEA